MAHRRRRQKNVFDCNHVGFGKYCHRCKDEKAGRIKPRKAGSEAAPGTTTAGPAAPKRTWKRAKCPFCGGSRVKKNELNVFSPIDAKEYRCTSYECGKEFNSDQVKEYEEVEVRERPPVDPNPRLTD